MSRNRITLFAVAFAVAVAALVVACTDHKPPAAAETRLLVIDGGLSRAYQPVTGIAGYTLIFTSHELNLVAHQPFESTAAAISAEQDIHSVQSLVKRMPHRLLIDDTDDGEDLRCRIDDLMRLITAYRKGVIKEARS